MGILLLIWVIRAFCCTDKTVYSKSREHLYQMGVGGQTCAKGRYSMGSYMAFAFARSGRQKTDWMNVRSYNFFACGIDSAWPSETLIDALHQGWRKQCQTMILFGYSVLGSSSNRSLPPDSQPYGLICFVVAKKHTLILNAHTSSTLLCVCVSLSLSLSHTHTLHFFCILSQDFNPCPNVMLGACSNL
jgi:hypothetical protein